MTAGEGGRQPLAALTSRADEVDRCRTAARRDVRRLVTAESERVGHLAARLDPPTRVCNHGAMQWSNFTAAS